MDKQWYIYMYNVHVLHALKKISTGKLHCMLEQSRQLHKFLVKCNWSVRQAAELVLTVMCHLLCIKYSAVSAPENMLRWW